MYEVFYYRVLTRGPVSQKILGCRTPVALILAPGTTLFCRRRRGVMQLLKRWSAWSECLCQLGFHARNCNCHWTIGHIAHYNFIYTTPKLQLPYTITILFLTISMAICACTIVQCQICEFLAYEIHDASDYTIESLKINSIGRYLLWYIQC